MDNICKRCFHNYVCEEYNADRYFPRTVCAYYNSHFVDAADVMEVRHGRWVDENKNPIPWDECNSKCPSHSAYCSECGEWLTGSDEYPAIGLYCPNCGALMKEDEHETG